MVTSPKYFLGNDERAFWLANQLYLESLFPTLAASRQKCKHHCCILKYLTGITFQRH